MQLIQTFSNGILPNLYQLQHTFGSKLIVCIIALIISLVVLIPGLNGSSKLEVGEWFAFGSIAIIALIGLGTTITNKTQADTQYHHQFNQIAKNYPYSIEIQTHDQKNIIVFTNKKPSEQTVTNIKNGQMIKSDRNHVIMYMSAKHNAINTAVLNNYVSNDQNNQIQIYQTKTLNLINDPFLDDDK